VHVDFLPPYPSDPALAAVVMVGKVLHRYSMEVAVVKASGVSSALAARVYPA
jgi:hypothetical protein